MEKKKTCKVIIVDDEESARKSIRALLEKDSSVEILAECGDGEDAAQAIVNLRPDLVFLDIQMPELDGFEVLEKIQYDYLPTIVFVTAYDQYAIKAFDHSAIDYVLKPFNDSRFYASLEKAKKIIEANEAQKQAEKVEALLDFLQNSSLPKSGSYSTKLTVKHNGRISFIPVSSIFYIESEGNFVKIHTESGFKIANYTFKSLAQLLNPSCFLRIHKSYIVNVDSIEGMEPHFHGDYIIYLKNGQSLKLSRNYKENLEKILNQ